MNVNLRLLKAAIEFLWWGGVVCTVIFMSNPTTVLRLCCVVAGVVTFVTQHLTSVENLGTIFSLSFCMILQKKGNIQILITQVL